MNKQLTINFHPDPILDAIPVGIAVFDAKNLSLLSANRAFQSFIQTYLDPKWSPAQLPEHSPETWLSSKLPTDKVHALVDIFRNVTKSGIPYHVDEQYVPGTDGRTYWNWALSPVRDEHEQISYLVVSVTEITRQVLAHQQAEEGQRQQNQTSQTLKNAFLSIASHELRTPITIIQGFAAILHQQIAQEPRLDTPMNRRAITAITEQGERLTHMIEGMLDLARIENARLQIHSVPSDLLATVQYVFETQSITSKDHQFRLVLEGLQETDTLIGSLDPDRMIQILSNLVSNAVKYSSIGSEIEIGLSLLSEKPREALLWVKDHGIGIPLHEQQQIFNCFYRAGNLDSYMSGFGIGLYLVKELVTLHKGRVWVESQEGVGSTFYIRLPL